MAPSQPETLRPMIVGANHRSSAMSLRDRLFVEDAQVPGVLDQLRTAGLDQAMVLSTCDRVEVLALHPDPEVAEKKILEIMARHAEVEISELDGQTYLLTDDKAFLMPAAFKWGGEPGFDNLIGKPLANNASAKNQYI